MTPATGQLALLSITPPVPPPSIALRCCDVAEVLAEVRGARLIHADPPWIYGSGGVFRGWEGGNAGAIENHYDGLPDAVCAAHVEAAYDCAAADAYLVLWTTWPKLDEWQRAFAATRWTFKSGGAWGKTGRTGVGFHWRGDSEPVLLYVKGNPRPADRGVSNLHLADRGAHSEKPAPFLRRMLAAFTSPNDLVLDLYAGLAPMARACALEGRRYVGAEIDPERHAMALQRLARAISQGAP